MAKDGDSINQCAASIAATSLLVTLAQSSHTHSSSEWEQIGCAVVFHALRRPHPEHGCEACYTAAQKGVCRTCLHFYATIAPSGTAKTSTPAGAGELEMIADEAFVTKLVALIAQLPTEAQSGVHLTVRPLQPLTLQA